MIYQRIIIIQFVLSLFLSCSKQESKDSSIWVLPDESSSHFRKWAEVFTDEEEIVFQYPDSSYEILSLPDFVINSKGDLIIPDAVSKQIKRFDRNGNFLQAIGLWGGHGPGEFKYVVALVLDNQDNLFIFDVTNYRLSKFEFPNYGYGGSLTLKTSTSSFIITPQHDLILYHFNPFIISKWDTSGNRLKETLRASESLRIFTKRFNLGGIVDYYGRGFFCIYPENFEIQFYDYNLVSKFKIISDTKSKFRPNAIDFPADLSPYDFTPEHAEWWDQFLHIARIFVIDKDHIGITLIETNNLEAKAHYFSLYGINGEVHAEGLIVPRNGIVRCAKNGDVYVSVPSQLDEQGNLIGPKLYKYKLKIEE